MTSAEFAGWIAYYGIEPWGEDRADTRSAIVAATIANVNRPKGKRPYGIKQFLALPERKPKGGGWESMRNFMKAFTRGRDNGD